MNHPDEKTLADFLCDSLSDQKNLEVDQHLESCADCRNTMETIIGNMDRIVKDGSSSSRSEVELHSPPKEIGLRFVVAEEIARGGMGIVYRGFDRDLKREVAIKISQQENGNGNGSGAIDIRFHREAQISAQLQHPGIVPVYQTGHLKDGRQYIAMKLVKGQTLAAIIRKPEEARQTSKLFAAFSDVCNTMAYAHSRNIIHRDLKPDNVMVGMFGEVQIMDWGLASKLSESTDEGAKPSADDLKTETIQAMPGATVVGAVMGTPAYMSPEQSRGEKADKRTDVFAMGGLLYEILTGQPPFDAPTASLALAKSIDNDLNSAFELLDKANPDAELATLVKSCLASDPNCRPADAEDVNQQFRAYLGSRESRYAEAQLEKARATERLIAQQKRIRQLVWVSVAIVGALLITTVAGYLYLTEKNARVANQARVDREQFEQNIEYERQIRSSLASARAYRQQAEVAPKTDRHTHWTLALKEIEKAAPFVDESIENELQNEFHELENTIRVETVAAGRKKELHELEDDCRQTVTPYVEHSFYPEDMRLCKWVDLLPKFEAAYKRIGIKPGIVSHDSIARLANSEFKTELIHGLMTWQREINMQLRFPNLLACSEEEAKETREWLMTLIDRADVHPLRNQIRMLANTSQFQEALNLARQEEATGELLTVHTFAITLNNADIDDQYLVEYLLQAHQKFPRNFLVNWYLPVMGGGETAKSEFALACYSLHPESPAALTALGAAFINEGQPERAVETLKKLTRVAPWYYLGHKNLAIAYNMSGKIDKAKQSLERAQKSLAESRGGFDARIDYYKKTNRTDRAQGLEQYLKNSESMELVEINATEALTEDKKVEKRRLEEAILTAKNKIEETPSYEAHHGALGENYLALCELFRETGRDDLVSETVEAAIEDFNEAAELDPDVATPHEQLSLICEEYGDLEVSIASLKKAIAIVPKYGAHHNRLGKLYTALIRHHRLSLQPEMVASAIDAAVVDLSEIAEQTPPQNPAADKRLSKFCIEQKRYRVAIVALKRILKRQPNYWPHRTRLADAYIALGQQLQRSGETEKSNTNYDLAIEVLRECAAVFPDEFQVYPKLSNVLELRGLTKESMDALKSGISIKRNSSWLDNYARLSVKVAKQLHSQNKADEAVSFVGEAYAYLEQFKPEHARLAPLNEMLGEFYAARKQFPEAIAELQKAVTNRPVEHRYRERLAGLYTSDGQPEEAEKIYQELLEESPRSEHLVATLASFYIDQDEPAKAASLIENAQSDGVNSEALHELLRKSRSL